jgi:PAS domain S-box-containing protein
VELKNKEWFNILGKIADHHGDPLIILDDSFEIIFSNQTAVSLFSIDDFNITLDQIFDKNTVNEISDNAGIALNTFKNKTLDQLELKLKSGSNLVSDISIELLNLDESVNVVLIFSSSFKIDQDELIKKIKILSSKNLSLIKSINLKDLISEIKNLAPFTIVALKKIQILLDSYDLPVWIKDIDGKLICINASYANKLGIENIFASGKKHEAFLPPHQKVIYNLLDQYIYANKQQIVLEGFRKKNANSQLFESIIQIPLMDNLNNIYAIIGLIVDNKLDYYNFWETENYFDENFDHFVSPYAIINYKGFIKRFNSKFAQILKLSDEELVDKKIEEVFPFLVTQNFNSFIKNNLDEESFALSEDFTPTDSLDYYLKIYLTKKADTEKRYSNVLMILEQPEKNIKFEDELQNILINRGKMFDILIQKNPEPIFIYDKENLKFLEVNDAAINLYGYSRDEFLMMDLTDLYAPEDIQTLLDSFGDEASESRFSKPFRHRKKDGTNVLVEISKTSFNFKDREAHFNIVKDITSSSETEKQNQMLKAIFAETDLIVFSTDASGFITFANHYVAEKLGFNNDEVLQSSFASLVIDEDRGIINTSIFQSHLKDAVVLNSKLKTSDDQYIDAVITATPILDFDGEVDSFTIVAKINQTTSTQFTSESEPKEIIKEVVKEVIVEKPAVVKPTTKIPDANFLSGMFHEILTPINVIIGFSQELINNTENPTEEQLEASEIINQNRIKMMDTMNSVVDYADILQNKSQLKIEQINITDIIEKLDNNIKDISGINDIQFAYGKISSSLRFNSDKNKFESFILSLIKVVSRLSKDKKIYFSAFPIDSDSFVIGISDQYGHPSEYVVNVLNQVFVNERDPKDFGLPKLTTYLSKTLLSFLGGKFYSPSTESLKRETGFLFPINFSKAGDEREYDKFVDEINEEVEIQKSEKFEEKPKEATEPTADKKPIEEKIIEDDSDIFNPSESVAEENISGSDEDPQSEEQYYASLANEVNSVERVVEEPVDVNSLESDVNDQVNISEELDNFNTNKQEVINQTLDLTKLNCLYLEDQVDSQILFKVQMKGLNDVKFAASFEEAQLILINHQFDFIVIDINLQGEYNGLDALKIIKTMPAYSSIPIIAVTAYVLPGDKEKFIAAGFDDFISKPIFREKMMESLEKVFLSK